MIWRWIGRAVVGAVGGFVWRKLKERWGSDDDREAQRPRSASRS